MKDQRRARRLSAALGSLLAVAGLLLSFWSVPVLAVRNADSGLEFFFRLHPPERFSYTYRHSMYDAPVAEEFEAGAGAIVLKGVRTRHPGVMEYYGFDRVADFHPLNIAMSRPIALRKGVREGQGLIIHERPLDLNAIAQQGERIEISLRRIPLGIYLFWKVR